MHKPDIEKLKFTKVIMVPSNFETLVYSIGILNVIGSLDVP